MKTILKKIALSFVLLATVGVGAAKANETVADSARVTNRLQGELTDLTRFKKATSLIPVSIKVQGRKLNVESPRMQMLPVYNFSGSFFCTFKLNKGTNQINGLPRGTYVINNRKYTIS